MGPRVRASRLQPETRSSGSTYRMALRATVQDGMMCAGVTAQPRVTILNFICDPSAASASITGYAEAPTCSYNFNISTSLACGKRVPAASH